MEITLIGGHGKVALLAAPLLVDLGHDVRSVIRNPDHADEVAQTGAVPVVTDIEQLDEAGFEQLLTGSDLVIWSAGAGGGSPERTYAVDRDAAILSMDAAAAVGVPRYLMVSYFGAGPDHGVPESEPFFAYADAKTAADDHLRGTSLGWTVLGPSTLTLDEPTGRIEVGGTSGSVSRADVAAVIAAVVDNPLPGHTVRFNNGDVPIAEALGA